CRLFDLFFFFFQAEDGIRDLYVTGVQTCALPIFPGVTFGGTFPKLAERADRLCVVRSFVPGDANHDIKTIVGKDSHMANIGSARSEERRVGKECRSRMAPYH